MAARPTTEVRRRAARPGHFWLVAAVLLLLMASAGAPSPLYVVYQAEWHFRALTLTAVFAVYALALLLALLTVGSLSDFVGRRPVLVAALVVQAASMLLFLLADGVPGVVVARIVQGVATGAGLGTISAALIDHEPPGRAGLGSLFNSVTPPAGLALGAVGSGLLVQYAPAPETLVFVVLGVAFLLLALGVLFLPETVAARPGALASLRPRIAVPPAGRRTFWRTSPALVATWALGGLYLSLGPSLAAGVLGLHNHLVGGLVIAAINLAAGATALAGQRRAPAALLLGGCLVLAAGAVITVLSLAVTSVPLFFVGSAVAGVGFGAAFLGAFRTVSGLAAPAERAELFAAVYVVSYLAFSVPAVLAGVATNSAGLRPSATGYGVVVIVLALLVAARGVPARSGRRGPRPDGPRHG